MDSVINHIKNVYGFELVSPSIPRNEFQLLKRNFYLFILNNVSEKLFYFLRDKVSPIKFMLERPDGEIWFRKRFDKNTCVDLSDASTIQLDHLVSANPGFLCEIEIRPIPVEAAIYLPNDKGVYKPDHTGNYKVKIYLSNKEVEFPLNIKCGVECIDAYFTYVPQLRESLRDYKLKKLFNE